MASWASRAHDGPMSEPLHADLTQRIVIDTTTLPWQPSPSPTVFRRRLDHLGGAENGRVTSVVRYDEFGRGLSDRPNVEYVPDLYDRQISELLDSLKVNDRIDIAGVSMGGAVTGVFAGRHPTRVRSLILVDPVAGPTGTTQGIFGWPLLGGYLWQTLAVPFMASNPSVARVRSGLGRH